MKKFRSFEEIDSWCKARELANEIYKVSAEGKLAKDVVLQDQIRRTTISIMSNIAEGFERGRKKEFLQLLAMAKDSVGEVKAQLYVVLDQGYISLEMFKYLGTIVNETGALISGLMNYLRSPDSKNKKSK